MEQDSTLGCLIIIGLIFGIFWLFGIDTIFSNENELTEYRLSCIEGWDNEGKCPTEPYANSLVRYRISILQHKVLQLTEDAALSNGIRELENCKIFDHNNWLCRNSNKGWISHCYEAKDGKIKISAMNFEGKCVSIPNPRDKQVSLVVYRWQQVKEMWFSLW